MTEETNQGMGEVQEFAAGAETMPDMLPESLFAEDEAMPETRAEAEFDAGAVKEEQRGATPQGGTSGAPSPTDKGSLGERGTSRTPSPTTTESAPAQTLKIKYNGREEDVSLEEAAVLAQKGKNYDHVSAERDELRGMRSTLERYAKASGLSLEDYMASLEERGSQAAEAEVRATVEADYPDADEGLIDELTRFRFEKSRRERTEAAAENERIEKEARVKPWREFMAAFPDVDVKSLPESVISEIQGGKSPIVAYQAHQNAELKREIEELKRDNQLAEQRGRNKALSVGSAVGDAAEKEKDDFLTGFLG